MSSFASNCPISRPLGYRDQKSDADFNGILWSDKWGFIFEPEEEAEPLRPPPVRRNARS